MGSHSRRQQYWARSYFGFTFMTSKHPNASHFALAAAEKAGRVQNLITQNVDGLHQDAGWVEIIRQDQPRTAPPPLSLFLETARLPPPFHRYS